MKPVDVQIFPDQRLDTKNTVLYLGISEKTLASLRCKGTGPRFIKRGNRVFYYLQDLEAWLDGERYTSTAQARLAKEGEQNG